MKLYINEEYQRLVTPLTKSEYRALRESMIIHGQLVPIIANQSGTILDGHNRFQICEDLGISPSAITKPFASIEAEKQFVLDSNLQRRNMNIFRKIEAVYAYYESMKKTTRVQAARRRWAGEKNSGRRTAEKLADKLKTSLVTVNRAIYLIRNADAKTLDALREDKLTITNAYWQMHDKERVKPHRLKQSSLVQCPDCKHVFKYALLKEVSTA